MTRREIILTRFIRSRGCAFLTGACALGFAAATYIDNPGDPTNPVNYGVAFPSANLWLSSALLSQGAAWIINLIIAAFLILLNRAINLLRTVSVTYASIFLLMQTATPELTGSLCDGVMLGLLVLLAMGLILSCYLMPERTPRVFLAFFLIGCGILWRYPYAAFLPALVIGLWQMRILSVRTLVAALLGLVTPIWLAVGFGLTNPLEWRLPDFDFDFQALLTNSHIRHTLVAGGVALTAMLVFTASDIIKILSYNAATRAYNGLLMTVTSTVAILVLIDWTNLSLYLTILNAMTACAAGHFLKIHGPNRGYLPILLLMIIYFTFYLWNLWVLI